MNGDEGRGVEGAETAIEAVRINSTKACKLRLMERIVGRSIAVPLDVEVEVDELVCGAIGAGGIEWVGTKNDFGSQGAEEWVGRESSSRRVG